MSNQKDLQEYTDSSMSETIQLIRPHYDKLESALEKDKCTSDDIEILEQFISSYNELKENLEQSSLEGREKLDKKVDLYNEYKNEVAFTIVDTEEAEFLRRQKGQLKIESSITEEFLVT